jgi:hypothetical protein
VKIGVMECWSIGVLGFPIHHFSWGSEYRDETTAVGKNVDFPPERLVDYSLLKEVQKELGIQ